MGNIHYLHGDDYKYKRFIVFEFDKYYPSGALEDVTGSFDTIEDVISYVRDQTYENITVFDCAAQKEVDITNTDYHIKAV